MADDHGVEANATNCNDGTKAPLQDDFAELAAMVDSSSDEDEPEENRLEEQDDEQVNQDMTTETADHIIRSPNKARVSPKKHPAVKRVSKSIVGSRPLHWESKRTGRALKTNSVGLPLKNPNWQKTALRDMLARRTKVANPVEVEANEDPIEDDNEASSSSVSPKGTLSSPISPKSPYSPFRSPGKGGALATKLNMVRSEVFTNAMRLQNSQNYSRAMRNPQDPRRKAVSTMDVSLLSVGRPWVEDEQTKVTYNGFIHDYSNKATSATFIPCKADIVFDHATIQSRQVRKGQQLRIYDAFLMSGANDTALVLCTELCEEYPSELPPLGTPPNAAASLTMA